MNDFRLGRATKGGYRLGLALSLLAFICTAVQAQTPGPPPRPLTDPKSESQDRQFSEARLRGIGLDAEAAALNENRIRAGIKQTKDDFKRIQVIRNGWVDELLARKQLNYKTISEQAAEINTRTNRLKSLLMPPVADSKNPDQAESAEISGEQIQESLVILCNLIYSFTQNPVFKNLNTTDVQDSKRAGSELLRIIDLSNNIQKSAEKLSKAPK